MTHPVRVQRAVVDELLVQARSAADLECCGLLAGQGGLISVVLPAQNVLRSPVAYEIAPSELFSLFRRMRLEGLDHLGIYHSHPRGENAPSPRDVQDARYPEAAYFILSPRTEAAAPVRAFRIAYGEWQELTLEIL